MTELGTALRALAGQAEPPHPADPESLWRHGRARVRRNRLIGVAVAAAAAIVVVVSTSSIPEPHEPMPAGPVHAPAIPENVYNPNRFLAGVSDRGAPGRLALIAEKQGDSNGGPWFGISATTGEYRMLDLPGIGTGSSMRLSPDGYRLAYWITGPTRKHGFGPPTPINSGGPLPDRPIAGVAVYDTRNGSVVRHRVASDYGLQIDNAGGLAWLTDDTLVFGYLVRTGSNTDNAGQSYRWRVSQADPVRLGGDTWAAARYTPMSPGSHSLRWNFSDKPDYQEVNASGAPVGRSFNLPGDTIETVSIRAGRVVTTGGIGSTSYRNVYAGTIPGQGGSVSLNRVGDVADAYQLGWLTDTSVLVQAVPAALRDGAMAPTEVSMRSSRTGLFRIDVVTGKDVRIGSVDRDLAGTVQVASALLGQPMLHGLKPPPVLAVFRTELIVASGLFVVVACWFVIRRRRRG